MRFKAHLQEAYLDREELEQTSVAACYGSANNIKNGEMEDAFTNFASEIAARDADFTELTTTNVNLPTQLRHQKYHIRAPQAELCNLKVVAATQTTNVKVYNKGVQIYALEKNRNFSVQLIQQRKNITI